MVGDFQFTPKTVNARVGDTISWSWQNGTHTTTSTSVPAGATSWDSPMNSSSTRFRTRVTVAGTYRYQCSFHFAMGMKGTIKVMAARDAANQQ